MNKHNKSLRITYGIWTLFTIAAIFSILVINYDLYKESTKLALIISISSAQIIFTIAITSLIYIKRGSSKLFYILLSVSIMLITSFVFLSFITINNILAVAGILIGFINIAGAWLITMHYAGLIGKTYKKEK